VSPADRPPAQALSEDGWCFVCGQDNPLGLRLKWTLDAEGKSATHFRASRHHQGWIGVVHGGILAAVLDEAMAQRLRLGGLQTVTARLDIRYRRPTPVDVPLIAEAWIESESAHGLHLKAVVRDEGGTRFAEAVGTCVQINPAPQTRDTAES
jgi:uncharacterized protein (TIGR00369 family)